HTPPPGPPPRTAPPPPLPTNERNGAKASSKPRARPPPPQRIEDQKTHLKPAPPRPTPAHVTRMQVNKPTLVGADPLPHDESTNSTLTRRARWIRRIQYAVVLVALAVAAWALLSTPQRRGRPAAGETANTGRPRRCGRSEEHT